MVFKQTGTFIGYESYYQKNEGGGMKSRWLFGGRPSLILAGGIVMWLAFIGLRSFQDTFTQWQLYAIVWAALLLSFGIAVVAMWLFRPTEE